jgi:transmembrane sensor
MSEAPQSRPLANATEIDARAASWLIKQREREGWSGEDQAAFDAWLSQSWAHSAAYWRIKAAWGYADRLNMLPRPSANARAGEFMRGLFPAVLKVAAAIAVVAALGAGTLALREQPQQRTYATLVGGRETVSFADGTKIELNTDTVIRARMTTNERTVWLDKGEAYFAVRHDPKHPFVVYSGNRRITDLGTHFLVRHDTGRTEVAVTQGSVRFDAPGSAQSRVAMLTPGDVATATGSAMSLTHRTTSELANELSWMHGVLIFKHTALGDAVSEFNRYSQTKLVIADPVVAALEIRGTFRTKDAALFARVVRDALKLHVENDGGEIVISR